eukprot:1394330-Amorphochlora_amoeboformis.AAC.1
MSGGKEGQGRDRRPEGGLEGRRDLPGILARGPQLLQGEGAPSFQEKANEGVRHLSPGTQTSYYLTLTREPNLGNELENQILLTLTSSAKATKEIRQSAYYLHVEAVKAKKAAQAAKKERLKQERMKKRRARR